MGRLRSTTAALDALWRAPRMSRASLEELRDSFLHRLICHAYESVPFYRDLFDRHRVRPQQIRTAADLERVPITDKTALQSAAVEKIVAAGLDPVQLLARSTSGSDGRPFVIYRTWLEQNLLHLFRLRAQRFIGVRATDRFVTVSLVRESLPQDNKAIGRALASLGLYRRSRINVFQDVDTIIDELRRRRPDVIGGYPGVLARVADRLGGLDEDNRPSPRFLLSGAEVLTPHHRRRIEDGFSVPVFDQYGCHEFNLVAWECRNRGGLHVCDDAVVVEVLDGDRPVNISERGEVVVTGLFAYAMPFIRYRLGDIAVRGEDRCSCGLPFSKLQEIEGRTFDHFVLPDGSVVHPHRLGRMLLSEGGRAIRQYQIVHERPGLVRVRIVPASSHPPNLEHLESRAKDILGPSVECEVRFVTEIPMEPSGKYRIYKPLAGAGRARDAREGEPT